MGSMLGVRENSADRRANLVAVDQEGVLTRAQALACGLSRSRISEHLRSGRWQRIHRGVYATFSGQVRRPCLLWAAVLCAGDGAVLSHETAAELWGLTERRGGPIRVLVPPGRTPMPARGVLVRQSRQAIASRHPTRRPPRTRVEDTVVDLTQSVGRVEDASAWLARAIGGRFTTADRLRDCLDRRPKLRWRTALTEAVRDAEEGSHSWLELAYLRDVERAHGLPRSQRQTRRSTRHYDDVRYRSFGVRVELDGRAAHPEHERFRDMRRDNAAAMEGDLVLRYGSGDVGERPCQVAGQVAAMLRTGGWTGTPRRCGRSDCDIP